MIRILLIGAGVIARHHAASALDGAVLPDGAEIHVADPNVAALAGFLAEFPSAVAHGSVAAMLALPSRPTDIAIVATPPFTHRELVLQALDSGRHVLCEKPLALGSEQGREMAAHADALGLALWSCDSRFRGLATTHAVRGLVMTGELGDLYHVTFVNKAHRARTGIDFQTESGWFRNPSLSGGGVSMDWGPYDVAVLDEVLQPRSVEVVHAWLNAPLTGGPFGAESAAVDQHVTAQMVVTLDDGRTIDVTYERAAATHGSETSLVEIEGTHGAVRWDWLDWVGDGDVTISRDVAGEPATEVVHFAPTEPGFHARPLKEMAAALRRGASPREITDQSLFSFLWLRAIVDAAASGQPQRVERLLA